MNVPTRESRLPSSHLPVNRCPKCGTAPGGRWKLGDQCPNWRCGHVEKVTINSVFVKPEGLLEAESVVARSKELYRRVWGAAKRMPEYRTMLSTTERSDVFEQKILNEANMINMTSADPLPDRDVELIVGRVAMTIVQWEFSPDRQRERQRKQVASRHRANRGRDLQIVRRAEWVSQRAVAAEFGISRGAVRKVLARREEILAPYSTYKRQ